MHVLVTGGTGFVGVTALRALLAAGHRVSALVRPGSERKLPRHANCRAIAGDSLNVDDVARALADCDAVVHMVGIRREQMKRTGLDYGDVDVGSVRVMAHAMQAMGVRRLLLLSAGAIGNSRYVRCKAEAERIALDAGLDVSIWRPSFILGPGQQWPIVMEPIIALLGLLPGHIGDTARRARAVRLEQLACSMVWALDHPESIGTIFDVPRIRTFPTNLRT